MFRIAIFLALVIICLPTLALAEIGRIKIAIGDAFIERAAEKVTAASGVTLEQSDVLVTGSDGRISVTFIDNSRFSVGPDSRVSLKTFKFDTTTLEGQFDVNVEKGTLAIYSGQIAKSRPDAMKVRTPTSILGVRGTRFIVEVQPILVLLPGEDDASSGAVAVNNEAGETSTVVEKAYAVAKVGSKNLFASTTDEARIRDEHGELLDTIPAPLKSYLIYFNTGTTELTPASVTTLVEMLKDVNTRPGADVQVTGHTDTVGGQRDNDGLSLNRAQFIKERLEEMGIDPSSILATGRGERALLVETPDATAEEKNRRVEIIVR